MEAPECRCSVYHFYGDCGHSRGELEPWRPRRPPRASLVQVQRRSVIICHDEENEVLRKRQQVIDEILKSENTYYNRLQAAWDEYICPMQESRILSDDDIATIFFEWETLLGIHKRLNEELASANVKGTLNVGSIFNNYSHFFKMYQPYLNNYSQACDRRGELLVSHRKFGEFCQEKRRDERCQKQSLMDLMIEPVQRIPRYQLLLERALKYTPNGHTEHSDLTSALERIKHVAVTNNEALARSEELRENQDKILEVMMSFTWNTRINLLDDPSRKLLLEGMLERQTRKTVKDFQFWLFTDKLIYGEAVPGTDGVFILHRDISLASCQAAIPPPRHTCDDIERAIYI
jgi:FYVE, RhoGEF and PH domain containing 5/6